MLMFGQPCDNSGISAYGNYRHVGPLTASRDRGYRCARRVGLGTDAGVAGGEVRLVPIPAPDCAQPDYDEGVDRHPGRTSNLLATAPALGYAISAFVSCVARNG
jgi:hypothetical protein